MARNSLTSCGWSSTTVEAGGLTTGLILWTSTVSSARITGEFSGPAQHAAGNVNNRHVGIAGGKISFTSKQIRERFSKLRNE